MSEENFEDREIEKETDMRDNTGVEIEQESHTEHAYEQQYDGASAQTNYGYQTDYSGNCASTQGGYGNKDAWKQQYTNPNVQQKSTGGSGFGIAAMVLGIVSLVLFCTCINVPLAIAAIIFAILQMTKGDRKGMAIAGLVTGIASIVCFLVFWALIVTGSIGSMSYSYSLPYDIERQFEEHLGDEGEHSDSIDYILQYEDKESV